MLLGKTGNGKSTSGNRILGKKAFRSKFSPESVTTHCQKSRAKVGSLSIEVVDTPGSFDTKKQEENLRNAVGQCIDLSVPGPHAFLLVLRLDMRLTREEVKAIEWITQNFGEEALNYTIILFTHIDNLEQTVEQSISESQEMVNIVTRCGKRYQAFNNEGKNNYSEVTELLNKVKEMVQENDGKYYTSDLYKAAQKKLKKEKVIDGVLGAVTAVGAGVAIAGGVALAAASAVVVPVIVLGAGAAVGIGASAGIITKKVKKKKQEKAVDSGSRS